MMETMQQIPMPFTILHCGLGRWWRDPEQRSGCLQVDCQFEVLEGQLPQVWFTRTLPLRNLELFCTNSFGEAIYFSNYVFVRSGRLAIRYGTFVEFHCTTPSKVWPTEPLRRWNHQLWIWHCSFGRLFGWSGILLQVYLFGTFWTLSCQNTTALSPPR